VVVAAAAVVVTNNDRQSTTSLLFVVVAMLSVVVANKQQRPQHTTPVVVVVVVVAVVQWFPGIADNGPKTISGEVCGATSENFFKSHRNQLLCTLNSNLLMPWLMYIQCSLTQNDLH